MVRKQPQQIVSASVTATNATLLTLFACLVAHVFGGCASYQSGNVSLYNPSVRTIYVPIVRNDTFRPSLGVQLTEALQKAIELRTPYKVIADPSADSTLTVRISTDNKRVITETRTDEPRALEAALQVELNWLDRRGNVLIENRFVPPGEFALSFTESSQFVPEGGQSISTAYQRAIEQLADQIVNQMELRW